MNDFSAYGNLVGRIVKEYNACPYCGVDTTKCRFKYSGKNACIGHRRWLPHGHEFRDQYKALNNTIEREFAPAYGGKKSIFYNLEFWKRLLVHHQLNVMHIEKKVCESIYGTLLHNLEKTKDGLK